MADTAHSAAAPVVACVKWVALRPDVDQLTGTVHTDDRWSGASPADLAAVEWALRIAEHRGAPVVVVTVAPASADALVRDLLAVGAQQAIRVDLPEGAAPPSATIATLLADAIRPLAPSLVLCGDWSLDRGSGSVPPFLAARLALPQACGLVQLTASDDGSVLHVERRLDGGRRERLVVDAPAVLSVEGATARLRRAPITGVLAARQAVVDVRPLPTGTELHGSTGRPRPFRPRARVLPGPATSLPPLQRVEQLTGALSDRTPPQRLTLDPEAAADRILEQLEAWGYDLPADDRADRSGA